MNSNKQVRMYSKECDKTGIMSETGEIPSGCITMQLITSAKHLTKDYIGFEANSKFV